MKDKLYLLRIVVNIIHRSRYSLIWILLMKIFIQDIYIYVYHNVINSIQSIETLFSWNQHTRLDKDCLFFVLQMCTFELRTAAYLPNNLIFSFKSCDVIL